MVKTNSPILVNGRRFLRAAMGQLRRPWRLAAGASESTIPYLGRGKPEVSTRRMDCRPSSRNAVRPTSVVQRLYVNGPHFSQLVNGRRLGERNAGLSLLKTPSALWALKLISDGTIFQESCVNSSSLSCIRFLADFGLATRLHLEIIALRHQLGVLQRKVPTRPRLKVTDRWLWVALSRLWSDWRSSLVIVKPGTVVAWHRKGFRLYWTWKSRQRIGRPKINTEVREIIQKMSRANPLWGAPRIHGELLKLGLDVSQATVCEVHGTQPSSAVAVLADVSRQSHFAAGFGGLLHCPNDLVRGSVRVCRSGS